MPPKKKSHFRVLFCLGDLHPTKVAGLFLLWLSAQRLHDFFTCFKNVGLFCACVCWLVTSSSSQRGLQRRVQDVILVAVAVGITVVALRTGRSGGFLQTHQHVHLQRPEKKSLNQTTAPTSSTFSSVSESAKKWLWFSLIFTGWVN